MGNLFYLRIRMASCSEQLDRNAVDVGYETWFDQGQGVIYLVGGEQCWNEVMEGIKQGDEIVSQTLQDMEKQGEDTQNWMKDTGIPSYEDYVGMRDMVTDYTAGHLMVTSWRWRSHEVEPGQSAGLCIGEQDDAKGAYWSCWEYQRREDGGWDDMPKAYLVNPANFNQDSRLNNFENLNVDSFP